MAAQLCSSHTPANKYDQYCSQQTTTRSASNRRGSLAKGSSSNHFQSKQPCGCRLNATSSINE
eukprot:6196309-Pleurochrysis_carterae.AAC.3